MPTISSLRNRARFARNAVRIARRVRPIPQVSEGLAGSHREFIADRFGFLERVVRECGPVGRFHVGPLWFVVVSSPEIFQTVFVRESAAFDRGTVVDGALRAVVGSAIGNIEGSKHLRRRKLLQPAFQPKALAAHTDDVVAATMLMREHLSDGAVIPLTDELVRLTISISAKTFFGADLYDDSHELMRALRGCTGYIDYVLANPIRPPLRWPTATNRHASWAIDFVKTRIEAIIRERQAATPMQQDLLSLLLSLRDEDGDALTAEEVRDDCRNSLLAGQESTSLGLTWCIDLLTRHPDAYERLLGEVDTVLGSRLVAYPDLPRLVYTSQVVKEALRLYPPVSVVGRRALRDLDLHGYPIAEHQNMMMWIYNVHHRADLYPDPERFDPERFTPANESALPKCAYLPFGAGAHACLGRNFAMLTMVLVLVTLVQQLRFERIDNQPVALQSGLVLRPKQPLRMRVHDRARATGPSRSTSAFH